MFVFCAAATTI